MIDTTSINNQIGSLVKQISTGRKEQTPLEKVRATDAGAEQSRLEKGVEISNRLEIRMNQQADTLGAIDEQLNRAYELMIDNESYSADNADIVNAELTQIRDSIVSLLDTKNVQGETMFDKSRQQYDGAGRLIEEFGDGDAIRQSLNVIDSFINNKDMNIVSQLQDVQEDVLVELTKVGLKMQGLEDARDQSNKKIAAYQEIEALASEVDLTEAITRLKELQQQQEAMYKTEALTGNKSLFDYL